MKNVDVQFYSGTKGARVALGDNTGYVFINCHNADAKATISVSGLGTKSPQVILKNASKPIICDIDILIPTKQGITNRTFTIRDAEILPEKYSSLECAVVNARDIFVKGISKKRASLTVVQQSSLAGQEFSTLPISIIPSERELTKEDEWMKMNPVRYTGK
jgi:hypothetical protein